VPEGKKRVGVVLFSSADRIRSTQLSLFCATFFSIRTLFHGPLGFLPPDGWIYRKKNARLPVAGRYAMMAGGRRLPFLPSGNA